MLTTEIRGAVAWLTLDRPEKLNAMPRSFYNELRATAKELEHDDAVRVIVIHGAGKCFSVGGDIDDFGNIPEGVAARRAYMREALDGFRAWDELPKPTIAAVHGHALGGGCELTMVCDLVVADETARFGTPEAGVGLFPGPGVVRGRSNLTLHALKYMIFTGAALDAQQALTAGLVNEVVPAGEHLARAEEWANTISTKAPLALATAKALLSAEGWERAPHVVDGVAMLQGSDDFGEEISAFNDRRPPRFEG